MTMSSTLTLTLAGAVAGAVGTEAEEAAKSPEAGVEMFSDADMAEVRHVVQRILVPCVFVIGLLGNSVSIYVLTRKRMRCTTNIYLTALAITDIAYLTFQLILTLQHYEYIKYHCEIYWRLYGYFVWLCDVSAYISIYIAVCFTIERFIAIRYPLKRQTFCTESLAKRVISAVALFCLLSTLSTAFEHTMDIHWKLIDDAYKPCNQTPANVSPTPSLPTPATVWHQQQQQQQQHQQDDPEVTTIGSAATFPLFDGSGNGIGIGNGNGNFNGDGESGNIPRQQHRRHWPSSVTPPPAQSETLDATELWQQGSDVADGERDSIERVTESLLQLSRSGRSAEFNHSDAFAFNVTEYCQNMTVFTHTFSELGNNDLYVNVWSLFTLLVFVLFPLFLLATFNCFLILLVHRSKSLRGDLTNASSIRRTKRKSHTGLTGSVSQENRVTITLIAVVLLFIVCQLPWAIYLILDQYMVIAPGAKVIAGNVCNLLAALNAASNFFLYCVLSDKYRKTVRELITGYRYRRRHARNNTSLYVPHTTTTLTHINGDHHHHGAPYGGAGGSSRRSCSRSRNKATATGRLIA